MPGQVRTLSEIIQAAKAAQRLSSDEAMYAICALDSLTTFDSMQFERIGGEEYEESFNQGIAMPERLTPEQLQEQTIRKKGIYVGAPACFALEQACRHIWEAFDSPEGCSGCYVVGSALSRPDWRDVDVRFILSDEQFAQTFPAAGQHWEHDPRWLLLTVSISQWLSKVTGLPIDFQFQPQTHANERHPGPRNAIGFRIGRNG